MAETRACPKCGREYAFTKEFFYERRPGVLRGECKECAKKRAADWQRNHPEEYAERLRRWAGDNREHLRAYNRKRRETKGEEVRAYHRTYDANNRGTVRGYKRKWEQANPDKRLANVHARRARLLNAEGKYTPEDIVALFEQQEGSCYYCGVSLEGGYHIDHYLPLALGGSNWPSNLVLACEPCNCRKGSKHPDVWLEQIGA